MGLSLLQAAPTVAASEQAAVAVLVAAGFRIDRTFGNHLVVDAEAGSATVESLFGATLHDVAQGRFGTRYVPAGPVTIPASLAPYVAGISLDDVVTMANPTRR